MRLGTPKPAKPGRVCPYHPCMAYLPTFGWLISMVNVGISIPYMEHMRYSASNLLWLINTNHLKHWTSVNSSTYQPVVSKNNLFHGLPLLLKRFFTKFTQLNKILDFRVGLFENKVLPSSQHPSASSSLRNRRGKIPADRRWDLRLVFFPRKIGTFKLQLSWFEASKLLVFIRFLRGALKIQGEDRNKNHLL